MRIGVFRVEEFDVLNKFGVICVRLIVIISELKVVINCFARSVKNYNIVLLMLTAI